MQTISFIIKPSVNASAIANLRAAVGWNRADEDYPRALQGYWAYVGGFTPDGTLVAWCAVVSDGVRHAILLDVIVHPDYQRQGVGLRLVRSAIEHCLTHGIDIIHVDFEPHNTVFYEKCGFRTGQGGIYAIPPTQ